MEPKAARPVHKKRGKKIIAVIIILILACTAAGIVFMYTHKATTISDNIYVNSLYIGGMNVKEATEALDKEFPTDYFGKTVDVSYMGKNYEVDLLGIVKLNAEETAKEALNKSNNLWERMFDKEKVVIPFELEEKEEELSELILDFVRNAEDETGVFTFNKDYTSVDVNADLIDDIMDIDETVEKILDNAELNVFDTVEAVMINKSDEDYPEELCRRLNRPAQNATIGINEDDSTFIIPEEVGIIADEDKFEDLYEEHRGVFTMDIKPVVPEIKTADLDIEFYQDVLGSYTSAYNVGLVNRSKNLSLAARLVNGTVIMPGERFSYNGTVGKRTYERGFVDATVYTGEGTEEGIGGGICQVSSTIYCAQLRADLKTISRTNHSYTVVYVPLGQDATVVYGSIDYVFENNTTFPIKILANANGGYLTVKIMGTNVDKTKTVDVVSVTESTIAKGEVQKETDELPAGKTEIKQNGQSGAVVSTYKVYYKNGVEQNRIFVDKSRYRPMNKIVLVGTAVPDDTDQTDDTNKPVDTENGESVDKSQQNPSGEDSEPVISEDNKNPETDADNDNDTKTDVDEKDGENSDSEDVTNPDDLELPTSENGL